MVTAPAPVCEPATVDLTTASVTVGSTGGLVFSYWKDASGTVVLPNPNSVTSGNYFIKGTNAGGCPDIKPIAIVLNPLPLAVATPVTSSICTGSTSNVLLSTSNTITGGVNYAWTTNLVSGNVSGYSDSNGAAISQNLTTTTGGTVRYTITPTSVIGCMGPSITTDVSVTQIPDVAINTGASTAVVCSGCSTSIVLQNPNNVTGTTFLWTASVLNGTVSGHSSGSGSTISQVLTKSTTTGAVRYTITPKAGTCNGSPVTFDVRINAAPTANAGLDQPIFFPINSVVLNGSGIDADGTIVSYAWSKLTGPSAFTLQNAATPTLTVTDLIVGTYVFRLVVEDNDTATGLDDVTVVVSPKVNLPPIVSAGPDINLQLPANQVSITGTASDSDGTIKSTTWSQVSGPTATLNVIANTLELTNLLEGTYLFRFNATDNGDVTASDDVNITVAANDFMFTTNRKKFITPNGDGQNDFWVLDPNIAKFSSCKLIILQNDGSKVLETTGYQNNWDGTANGKVLPQDVYYYVLECNGVRDSGSITIIR